MAIEVGSKVTGKVSGITNFGAFVDLGDNKTGLVHISEVSDRYVKDIREELQMGQEILVKVLTVGNDGKIGLSIRKAQEKALEPAAAAPREAHRPSGGYQNSRNRSANTNNKQDFDSLMSSFLKDSEDRLSTLKRSTESKRGGRGGRKG